MNDTPIDRAHAAMTAAPDDDVARLRFFERLGDAELFLLLAGEAEGDQVSPQTFETGGETLVLVFDREDRLATFAGQAPYAALSGRALSGMLAAEGLGLALNPEVAPSSFVLDAEGTRWLAETLAHEPDETESQLAELTAPEGLPQALLEALDQKLAATAGLAQTAYLAGTRDAEGGRGHLMGFVGCLPGAEGALARAVSEALIFSGIEAGLLDVGFFAADSTVAQSLARAGLRFDLPQPLTPLAPTAPGRDPDNPPKLR